MKITDAEAPYMVNGFVAEIDEKTKHCAKIELINLREIN
jgi:calcineurin-like phosphoesterase